jgi:choline-sulfatase
MTEPIDTRPNILYIFTDQQSATMMSCAGNAYLETPAMDSLAADGVRFERAYCTNPVCLPSRFSMMTGRMPSIIDVRSNNHRHVDAVPEEIRATGLGWLLREAGYDTAYGGKVHLPRMTPEDLGFDVITGDERDGLAEACASYIREDRERPFLLVASFINPHDICYMAIRDFAEADIQKRILERGETELAALDEALQIPEGISREAFFETRCPPLPDNFEPQQDEPEAIRELQAQRPFKQSARRTWGEARWRMHRWAYCRLTERVDAQIGHVLDALRASGKVENTVVVFSSDHGDMDGAHRMEHKTAFYEEACRVPLIVSQPGTTPAGAVDETHLVSNGLDLIPTFCDYAGIEPPEDLQGVSFRPLAEGRASATWRGVLPIEGEFGRALVTERYKYALYDRGEHREQLLDLKARPLEMRNAAYDADKRDVLAELRAAYLAYYGSDADPIPA